jgi:hypothetical protein
MELISIRPNVFAFALHSPLIVSDDLISYYLWIANITTLPTFWAGISGIGGNGG